MLRVRRLQIRRNSKCSNKNEQKSAALCIGSVAICGFLLAWLWAVPGLAWAIPVVWERMIPGVTGKKWTEEILVQSVGGLVCFSKSFQYASTPVKSAAEEGGGPVKS